MAKRNLRNILVIVSSHVTFHQVGFIEGSVNMVRRFLCQKNISVLELRYSIRDAYRCEAVLFLPQQKERNIQSAIKFNQGTSFDFFRWGLELLNGLMMIYRYRQRKILFIGADPLNGLAGCLARKLGWVDWTITYTVDYAKRRFENPFLNWVYHLTDRWTVAWSDENWCVSRRIVNVRRRQGTPKEKILYLPNSAFFAKIKRLSLAKIDPHALVIVSQISKAIDFRPIINALGKLKRKIPAIKLNFIGGGDFKSVLVEYVRKKKLADQVNFLGFLSREKVYQILARSAIGIAPYTKSAPWVHYCSPMKIYDYLACGLPVLTTIVPGLAHEVVKEGAGEIFKLNDERDLAQKILKIMGKPVVYRRYRKQTLYLAKKYDKEKLLTGWFGKSPFFKKFYDNQ